jgi:hypothetical protein
MPVTAFKSSAACMRALVMAWTFASAMTRWGGGTGVLPMAVGLYRRGPSGPGVGVLPLRFVALYLPFGGDEGRLGGERDGLRLGLTK